MSQVKGVMRNHISAHHDAANRLDVNINKNEKNKKKKDHYLKYQEGISLSHSISETPLSPSLSSSSDNAIQSSSSSLSPSSPKRRSYYFIIISFFSQMFSGLMKDIKVRLPYYFSDYRDGMFSSSFSSFSLLSSFYLLSFSPLSLPFSSLSLLVFLLLFFLLLFNKVQVLWGPRRGRRVSPPPSFFILLVYFLPLPLVFWMRLILTESLVLPLFFLKYSFFSLL